MDLDDGATNTISWAQRLLGVCIPRGHSEQAKRKSRLRAQTFQVCEAKRDRHCKIYASVFAYEPHGRKYSTSNE